MSKEPVPTQDPRLTTQNSYDSSMLTPSDTVYSAVRTLRVVRAFTDEAIDPAILDEILDAGRWTGSSKNVQGWVLLVVGDEDGRRRVASAGSFTQPVLDAQIVVCLVRTEDGNDFDIGRLAQNLMLAAASRSIGSCPVTLHDSARAHEVLGLAEGDECRYAIALGHPDDTAEEAARHDRRARGVAGRKAPTEVIRHIQDRKSVV